MKKAVFLCIFILSIFLFVFAEEDDLLKIEVSLIPKSLSKNQQGKVVLKLNFKEGITVSPQPFFVIELNPCEELAFSKKSYTASDLAIEVLGEEGEKYLNLNKTVEIPFMVRSTAKRGNHHLEGEIKYFACFKEEGLCLKNISKFSASFATR